MPDQVDYVRQIAQRLGEYSSTAGLAGDLRPLVRSRQKAAGPRKDGVGLRYSLTCTWSRMGG